MGGSSDNPLFFNDIRKQIHDRRLGMGLAMIQIDLADEDEAERFFLPSAGTT